MQTQKDTGQFMQCACGMQGFGVEPVKSGTFRHRTFHVTSKDRSEDVHRVVFQWRKEDQSSTGECFGQV